MESAQLRRQRLGQGRPPNQCLSAATACLYGLSEAAILAAGYAPAIGFLHRGKPQSFVYDIADIFKFETVVPVAFQTAARVLKGKGDGAPAERQVRIACRDIFRRTQLLDRLIPSINEVLSSGGLDIPEEAPEAIDAAIPLGEVSGDDGHRG
jgi:CRISP-associated protein Cas1